MPKKSLVPKPRPRTKTKEKTLRGRPVWIDETGDITGEKGTRYSEVTTTIPWGTSWITAPSIDKDGSKLSDEEVSRRLKDNEGKDFLTGEKLPTFENEPDASGYAEWRSDTMFDQEQIEKGYKPVLEQQQYEEDVEETLTDKVMRKAKPFTDEVKGFVDYLMTPSQHFDEGGFATQMQNLGMSTSDNPVQTMEFRAPEGKTLDDIKFDESYLKKEPYYFKEGTEFKEKLLATPPLKKSKTPTKKPETLYGYTEEGLQQEADKFAEEFNEQDQANITKAAEFLVPFYDSGVNIGNVIEEYMKPEDERDNEYIKEQFKQAGQSAAIEGGMLLLGGVFIKYGSKGIKALYNKAKQYEIDPSVASAFGVGSIKKKAVEPLEIGINEALQDGKFLKGYDSSVAADMAEKAKNATAGKPAADVLINTAVPEGTKVGIRLNLNSKIPDMPKGLDKLQTLHKGSYSGKALSYLPFATVKNVVFSVSQTGRTGIASKIKGIDTPEAKNKFNAMSVDGEYIPNKNLLDSNEDLVEISFNPAVHHLFIDLKTGQAVRSAKEATVIGDRAYARGVEYWKKAEAPAPLPTQTGVDIPSDVRYKFKEGGIAMKDDTNMGYALGGEVDAIDPVSGNEIPPGSTAKEVRDDIPAMLSEGEYVVPADVLKFYGLRFFEGLRNKAKIEMSMLEEDGRMGGQPTPEGDDLTEDEMRLLDEVMGMAEGGMTPMQPQPPQPMMMGQQMPPPKPQPTTYNKPVGFNTGGMTDAFGNPINPGINPPEEPTKYLQDIDQTSTDIYGIDQQDSSTSIGQTDIGVGGSEGVTGVSGGGMKTVFYIHKDGRRISVLMLNGKPISSVPADFGEFMEDTPENRIKLGIGETGEPEVGEGDQQQVTTEGSSGSEDPNESVEVYKASGRKKPDASTYEGSKQLYEESGVNVQDPVGQAKKILEGTTDVPKGAGILAGAVSAPLAIGLGGFQAVDNLTAVSKAQANKQMAEFLGMESEAAAIQTEIDKFVKSAPGIVGALDEYVASGDQRFGKALESVFSINAPSEAMIQSDKLSEKGKANVDEYLSQFNKVDPTKGTSLRPKARPGNLGEAKPEITQRREVRGKYDVLSNKKLSGGYNTSTLSASEQKAFDNAVDSGSWQTANHFAQVNRHRNKQDEFAKSGYDPVVGRSLGLSQSTMDQAKKYGGSVQTAINDGRAKRVGFFKPVEVIKGTTASTPVKTTPVKTTPVKTTPVKTNTSSNSSSSNNDFHSNMVAKAAEKRKSAIKSVRKTAGSYKPKKERGGGDRGMAKGGLMGKNK